MNHIEAVFFDLDGTLIDSEVLWIKSYIRHMKHYWSTDISFPKAEKMVYGIAFTQLYENTVSEYKHVKEDAAAMERAMREHFRTLRKTADILIPSSIALLKKLSADFPVAIISGSPREDIAEAIKLMGLGGEIAFYLGAEDYHQGKPNPEPYRKGAEKMHIRPQHCLVFEDSHPGVLSAKNAGMRCVALKRKKAISQDVSKADMILPDLNDFDTDKLRLRTKADFTDITKSQDGSLSSG